MKKLNTMIVILTALIFTSPAYSSPVFGSSNLFSFEYEGVFTLTTGTNGVLFNPDQAGAYDLFGVRTPISGMLTINSITGAGSMSVDSFTFSGTALSVQSMSLQAIGDGTGGNGSLIMSSILFDYGPTLNIPAHLIADATGLFSSINAGLQLGDVITGGTTSSSQAAIDADGLIGQYTPDIGQVPFAMTSLDALQDQNGVLINSGFPLADDGVSGVLMATAPIPGHALNFDLTSMTAVPNIQPVPVPAAVWLFGSGLIGLAGFARRKKA